MTDTKKDPIDELIHILELAIEVYTESFLRQGPSNHDMLLTDDQTRGYIKGLKWARGKVEDVKE